MRDRLGAWPLRVVWVAAPFLLGPLLADALDERTTPLRTVVSVALWVGWALTLVALLVPRPVTLTLVRTLVPASLPVAVWAAAVTEVDAGAALGLTAAALATVLVLDPVVGELFVDGASYGSERRFPLAPTAAAVLGPIPLGWAVALVSLTVGPLLLADGRWVLGGALTAVGAPLGAMTLRALHTLARRWLILVPGGLVVHDVLALREPVLVPTSAVAALGPAPNDADDERLDLTGSARGLAIEIGLSEPVGFGVARSRTATSMIEPERVAVTPSRPGRFLDAAAAHLRL